MGRKPKIVGMTGERRTLKFITESLGMSSVNKALIIRRAKSAERKSRAERIARLVRFGLSVDDAVAHMASERDSS